MTCKACRVQMRELKGHIYHKKRKVAVSEMQSNQDAGARGVDSK
jgi:hypothetical protein